MPSGGIIGKVTKTSFGKNKVTAVTSTGNYTTQPGTRAVHSVVIAGGGGGGADKGGGGGAGGLLNTPCTAVSGNTAYPITIGAGGTRANYPPALGENGSNSIAVFGCTTLTGTGGGRGGSVAAPPDGSGNPGGSGGGGSFPGHPGSCGTACQGNYG